MRQRWHLRLVRARRKIERLTLSIWFYPLLMTFGALALFILTSALDDYLFEGVQVPPGVGGFLIFAGSPSAARSVLSAIAGGWATILGVVISITLVTIQIQKDRRPEGDPEYGLIILGAMGEKAASGGSDA